MSYYTHLSTKELTFIEDYHEQGHSNRYIARKMRRSPETISRVIRKLQTGLNAPQIYDKYTENKKLCGRKKIELSSVDKEHIESRVKLGWTPDTHYRKDRYRQFGSAVYRLLLQVSLSSYPHINLTHDTIELAVILSLKSPLPFISSTLTINRTSISILLFAIILLDTDFFVSSLSSRTIGLTCHGILY